MTTNTERSEVLGGIYVEVLYYVRPRLSLRFITIRRLYPSELGIWRSYPALVGRNS